MIEYNPKLFLKRFGEEVSKIMIEKNLCPVDVANMTGDSTQEIHSIAAGEHHAYVKTVIKIANALGIDPRRFSELLYGRPGSGDWDAEEYIYQNYLEAFCGHNHESLPSTNFDRVARTIGQIDWYACRNSGLTEPKTKQSVISIVRAKCGE